MSYEVPQRPIYQKGQKPARKAPKPGAAFVSQALRDFARGRECQMKSEWCSGNPETVVFCHSRRRATAGMGHKPHDFWGYHGCAACHAHEHLIEDHELYDAIRRTQWAVFEHFGTLTPRREGTP